MASIRTVVYVSVTLFTMSLHSHAQPSISDGYGYGGVCDPGYDYGEDCPQRGSESSTTTTETSMFAATGLQSDGAQEHSAGSDGAAKVAMDSTTASPNCDIKVPEACTFPFVYKGQSFDSCTGIDAVGTKWCSTDAKFAGHWRHCTEPCKNLMVHQVVTGVVATGVAAAGVGLIAAAINSKKQEVSTSLPQTLTTTVFASPALGNVAVAPTVPPAVAAAAATPSAIPVSRLFELSSSESNQKKGSLRGQHSNHVAMQENHATLLLCFGLGLCFLCCAALCGALFQKFGAQKSKAKRENKVIVEETVPINQGS